MLPDGDIPPRLSIAGMPRGHWAMVLIEVIRGLSLPTLYVINYS